MIPASVKSVVKSIVPKPALIWARNLMLRSKIGHFEKMDSNEQIFDHVYSDLIWKEGTDTRSASGDGSDGLWLDESVKHIEQTVLSEKQTVLEIGCGDFNFGSKIAHLASEYKAGDVSGKVIGQNKERYKDLSNVEFMQLDATKDELPKADVVIIRQVLQHLPNAMIQDILSNVDKLGPKKMIVFEDVPSDDFEPNHDLRTAGPYTRHLTHSGVDLAKDPFNRPFRKTKQWLHPRHPSVPARLVCYELE